MPRLLTHQHHSSFNDNLSAGGPKDSARVIVVEALSEFDEIASRLTDTKTSIEKRFGSRMALGSRARPELIALQIIEARAKTDSLFHAMTVSDGHYLDILLDLFVSEAINRNVAVSDACLASRAPATTALRYLRLLEKEQLVQRRNDPSDQRRWFVSLTPKGRTKTLECIEAFSMIAEAGVENS